jgi:peptide/nickel transport system substrate-binding protein
MVEQVLFGQGRVATGPIHSRMTFAYTADVPHYPFDPEVAKALLDEAGLLPDERGVRFTINFVHFSAFSKYGEIVRQNLAAVGIAVELIPLDPSAFVSRVFSQRDFDTNVISYCNNSDPTIGVSRVYVSTNIGDIPFSNAAAYRNPRVDELFALGSREADPLKRGEIYAEVQRLLVDELPYLWLVETEFVAASRANVQGLRPWSASFAEAAWFATE